ncbi:MAG: aspartyl protease family protein, partial [Rhizomicrobium sp.]|nr:aspartyl protease family protein [Rhizomicrobium sp.]
ATIVAGSFCLGPASAADDCKLKRYLSLPMTIDEGGLVTVPFNVGGEQLNLMIDTGGVFSMVTDRTAARLKLRPQMMHFQWMTMYGGRTLDHFVEAPIVIGSAVVPKRPFVLIPDDSLPVSDDGILSTDILGIFDIDFDFAASKVGLFVPHPCEGKAVYWPHSDFAEIPFKLDEGRHIKVKVMLDGKEVNAIIDTGASRSVMSLETAIELFKLDAKALQANHDRHEFKTLQLNGVTVNNPNIILIPDDKSKILGGYREPEMLVGISVLRQLHMLIAFKERNIYVTPASTQ